MAADSGLDLERVAVVTGANRGIGRAIAAGLADLGLVVVMAGRDVLSVERSAAELGSNPARRLVPHQVDVIDPASVVRLMADTFNEFGRLDVLVNNAGIAIDRGQPAAAPDFARVQATVDTNVLGAWRCSAAAVTEMRKNGYGRIVNVTSHLGSLATMGTKDVSYRVAKAGLNALTRVLAAELAPEGILVNAASPGPTNTRMAVKKVERTPVEAADTFIWLATLPDDGPTGGLFHDRKPLDW